MTYFLLFIQIGFDCDAEPPMWTVDGCKRCGQPGHQKNLHNLETPFWVTDKIPYKARPGSNVATELKSIFILFFQDGKNKITFVNRAIIAFG